MLIHAFDEANEEADEDAGASLNAFFDTAVAKWAQAPALMLAATVAKCTQSRGKKRLTVTAFAQEIIAQCDKCKARPEQLMTSGGAEGERECVICADAPPNRAFRPCGHVCTCGACAAVLLTRGDPCPMCRSAITEHIQVFI